MGTETRESDQQPGQTDSKGGDADPEPTAPDEGDDTTSKKQDESKSADEDGEQDEEIQQVNSSPSEEDPYPSFEFFVANALVGRVTENEVAGLLEGVTVLRGSMTVSRIIERYLEREVFADEFEYI